MARTLVTSSARSGGVGGVGVGGSAGSAGSTGPSDPLRSAGATSDPPHDPAGAAAERFFRRMVGDAAWDRLPEAAKDERRADGPALEAELTAIRLPHEPFDVTAIAVPATFGRGQRSASRHRATVAWLAAHTPDGQLVEIAGASHGAHLTHPDAFASMVRTAVARAAAAQETTV